MVRKLFHQKERKRKRKKKRFKQPKIFSNTQVKKTVTIIITWKSEEYRLKNLKSLGVESEWGKYRRGKWKKKNHKKLKTFPRKVDLVLLLFNI